MLNPLFGTTRRDTLLSAATPTCSFILRVSNSRSSRKRDVPLLIQREGRRPIGFASSLPRPAPARRRRSRSGYLNSKYLLIPILFSSVGYLGAGSNLLAASGAGVHQSAAIALDDASAQPTVGRHLPPPAVEEEEQQQQLAQHQKQNEHHPVHAHAGSLYRVPSHIRPNVRRWFLLLLSRLIREQRRVEFSGSEKQAARAGSG